MVNKRAPTVKPLQNDHPLVQINVVFVNRWSLFAEHFLYRLDCLCTKSDPWKQVVAIHGGHFSQVKLFNNLCKNKSALELLCRRILNTSVTSLQTFSPPCHGVFLSVERFPPSLTRRSETVQEDPSALRVAPPWVGLYFFAGCGKTLKKNGGVFSYSQTECCWHMGLRSPPYSIQSTSKITIVGTLEKLR